MDMINMKKPFFWSYILINTYWISFLLTGMVAMPSSFLRVICGVGGALLFYILVISFRRPVSDKSYVGVALLIVGLIFIGGGRELLNELLYPPHPVNYYEYTRWFEVLSFLMATMIIGGTLTVLFSILGLITNINSKIVF